MRERAGAGGPPPERGAVERLARFPGAIRFGLARVARLLGEAGDPHRAYATLHVAGTNGKGSVAATLDAVLSAAGHRVGLFVSPPLWEVAGTVRVGGEPVGEAALSRALRALEPVAEREEATSFEVLTAAAFLAFRDAGVEVAVVEAGLGGDDDATNVVAPEVAVITNVALDHTAELGGTLEAIAARKAGVLKPGGRAVTAERDPAVLALLHARAREVGAVLHALGPGDPASVRVGWDGTRFRTTGGGYGPLELHTPLVGAHQAVNAALAVRAADLLGEGLRPSAAAVARGVREVRWPARLQVECRGGVTWIVDSAHNPAAASALAEALRALAPPRPLIAVVGVLADKDWPAVVRRIAEVCDRVLLTSPASAPAGRGWDPRDAARRLAPLPTEPVPDLADALRLAAEAAAGGGSVLVAGSTYTAGEALRWLGLAERPAA